ncbi:hypothetical protein HED54_04590 [Ochrobactrum anthropi ATCC 49188]|nr:hypothetical protein [Brucella anthropi ATCC 49188]
MSKWRLLLPEGHPDKIPEVRISFRNSAFPKTRDESIALARYADAKSSAEEELMAMRRGDYAPASSIDFSKSQQRASAQGRVLQDIRSLISDPISVRETVQALKGIKRVTTGAVKSFLCKTTTNRELMTYHPSTRNLVTMNSSH